MIGTILNGAAILVGGVAGLAVAREISAANQSRLKVALGVFVVYAGLSATWSGLNGTFGQIAKQIGIALLSLILGNLLGKLLRIQKSLNSLGQYARERFTKARPTDPNRLSEGFVTCSLLFCVGPMAILGAVQDGLTGDFKTLAIKSVMDGLATMAFSKTFGWGVILSLIPVVSYQGTLTLAAKAVQPVLRDQALLDSINATGGLLVCCLALIVLDLKKVRVADYLPSLAFAPLLTWFWR
ncbi:MAG: DUF554 domain-containing protein [Verrucomicrobia bacterium]|nr:DUF554 domain-containing protein [Verrucomicrobiota bacterium]